MTPSTSPAPLSVLHVPSTGTTAPRTADGCRHGNRKLLVGSNPSRGFYLWHCADCGHRWTEDSSD